MSERNVEYSGIVVGYGTGFERFGSGPGFERFGLRSGFQQIYVSDPYH